VGHGRRVHRIRATGHPRQARGGASADPAARLLRARTGVDRADRGAHAGRDGVRHVAQEGDRRLGRRSTDRDQAVPGARRSAPVAVRRTKAGRSWFPCAGRDRRSCGDVAVRVVAPARIRGQRPARASARTVPGRFVELSELGGPPRSRQGLDRLGDSGRHGRAPRGGAADAEHASRLRGGGGSLIVHHVRVRVESVLQLLLLRGRRSVLRNRDSRLDSLRRSGHHRRTKSE
jgi:hypothetical protein